MRDIIRFSQTYIKELKDMTHQEIFCSFCGQSEKHTTKIISNNSTTGSVVYICETCINDAKDLLSEESKPSYVKDGEYPSPKEIVQFLDQICCWPR